MRDYCHWVDSTGPGSIGTQHGGHRRLRQFQGRSPAWSTSLLHGLWLH